VSDSSLEHASDSMEAIQAFRAAVDQVTQEDMKAYREAVRGLLPSSSAPPDADTYADKLVGQPDHPRRRPRRREGLSLSGSYRRPVAPVCPAHNTRTSIHPRLRHG
jgi:hypothetical protein